MKNFATMASICAAVCSGCGSKSELDSDKDKAPVLSLLFNVDNSYRTLVKCAVDGSVIKCDEASRAPIPSLSSFRVSSFSSDWETFKFLEGPNGCFEGTQLGKVSDLEKIDTLEAVKTDDSCNPVVRLIDDSGTIVQEWGLVKPGVPEYFSRYLSPLRTFRLQVRNTEGESCRIQMRLKDNQAYSEVIINESDLTFSSGFSLHYSLEEHALKASVKKGEGFTYHWTPALDTAPLIAAGMDDAAVLQMLEQNLADFLVLRVSDPYGHQITCKVSDSAVGSVSIPGELMGLMERSAGFNLTRYRLLKGNVSPTAQIIWLMTIGEYTDRTDIGGVSGSLTIDIKE